MNYSFEETRDIIANNAVHVAMMEVVGKRMVPVKPTPPWPYAGRDNPTGPFRLFRGSVELAIMLAVTATRDKERERLLSLLRMAGDDTVSEVAKVVGIACEEYAVTMQHGADGWRSYQAFIRPYDQ